MLYKLKLLCYNYFVSEFETYRNYYFLKKGYEIMKTLALNWSKQNNSSAAYCKDMLDLVRPEFSFTESHIDYTLRGYSPQRLRS